MKLQKQLSKRTKEKDYYRYVLNVPPMIIREAGFGEGEELDIEVIKGKVTFKQKKKDK